MSQTGIARVFRHGRSQAVRLPREFRVQGDRVRVRRVEGGILLEPLVSDVQEWYDGIDCAGGGVFIAEGREQPITPSTPIFE